MTEKETLTDRKAALTSWLEELEKNMDFEANARIIEQERRDEFRAKEELRARNAGLTPRQMRDLRIGDNPGADAVLSVPPQAPWAAIAVRGFIAHGACGTMVLSGPNGVGKTTAAAWAAYKTKGLYVPRIQWAKVAVGRDTQDAERLSKVWGVLVLDEIAAVTGAGDSEGNIRLIHAVVSARHENLLPTIITTRSTYEDLGTLYGRDLIDRVAPQDGCDDPSHVFNSKLGARCHGEGGFVECHHNHRAASLRRRGK